MVLDVCGRYDTACFLPYFILFYFSKFKGGEDLSEPSGTSPAFIMLFPLVNFSRLGLAISLDKEF